MTQGLQQIQTVAVVGTGIMGAGIAQVFAGAGYKVLLYDQSAAFATKALKDIEARFYRQVEKGSLTDLQASEAIRRLHAIEAIEDLAPAQLVIEAIVEHIGVKRELFSRLEDIVTPHAILASNTSSLSIAAIGRDLSRRDRVCGMHFFNPVPLMKLVEVIPGPFTAIAVTESLVSLTRAIGKTPVVAKDGPGFLVNLGGRAYTTEGLHIEYETIAKHDQIDRIMRASLGFRMGPFELLDLTGIDVNLPVTHFIHQGHQSDPRLKTTPRHERLFEAGRFGKKVGIGFYDYNASEPVSEPRKPLDVTIPVRVCVPLTEPHLDLLLRDAGVEVVDDDSEAPILISPLGDDATTIAWRHACDPHRVVAIDFTGADRKFLTVMTPPVQSKVLEPVVALLRSIGYQLEIISDSTGFVAQRIAAMIVNLGCEMAQTGVGSPADIDAAMRLGLNYPMGPLELGDAIGAANVLKTLENIQAITGSDRYRPSAWLRRRALLALSLKTTDPGRA
jgi:3-hydroxybutyryl-CoA dehydrogenase